jgi:anti-sigma factor RsiW
LTTCESLRSLWETFLDGELPSRQMLELQSHLDGCTDCAEAVSFSEAIRMSARQVVYDDVVVSDDFRHRLKQALYAEAREESEELERVRFHGWRARTPQLALGAAFAAAAVLLLWLGSSADAPPQASAAAREATVSSLGPQELLDLFIDYHTAPPAPQVTEPTLVPVMERDVGVRVPLPSLAAFGAQWEGGSIVRVPRMQPAAYLRYRTRDAHIVTLYVYNASRIPLHASLKPRMFRQEPVYERNWRGYSIAAQLQHGVGYAVASDLDEAHSAELVQAITSSVVAH